MVGQCPDDHHGADDYHLEYPDQAGAVAGVDIAGTQPISSPPYRIIYIVSPNHQRPHHPRHPFYHLEDTLLGALHAGPNDSRENRVHSHVNIGEGESDEHGHKQVVVPYVHLRQIVAPRVEVPVAADSLSGVDLAD